MFIRKIHHLAIAVKNLDEAINLFSDLFGVKPSKIVILPDQNLKVAILSADNIEIEILEPINPNDSESPVVKFLAKRGEGFHHIAIEVKDINRELKRLSKKGIELIDKKPKKGLSGKVSFLHLKSTKGVLIELVEKGGRENEKD